MKDYVAWLEGLSRAQLTVLLARAERARRQGISISGMACRLPGGVDGPRSLWEALADRRMVRPSGIPRHSTGRPRWDVAAPDLTPLSGPLERGLYLDGVDLFDADSFGIDAREAELLDPQQRLALTCAREALGDAGLLTAGESRLVGARLGVFVGASAVEYAHAALRNGVRAEDLDPRMGTGSALGAIAGRVGLWAGAAGPVLTLDTACSSVLTATHLAVRALRSGECDVAVVGGVHLCLSPFTTAVFDLSGRLSPTARSRPLGEQADGYVRSEGVGMLVLEREQDSEARAATPYAVIRGTAVSHRGRGGSMATPSDVGQQASARTALEDAGAEPDDVGFLELHSNGNRVGDRVEWDAMGHVYRPGDMGGPALPVGSAKANFGYPEVVSGALGLMKTALSLACGELPAHPDVGALDPVLGRHGLTAVAPRTGWAPDAGLAAVNAVGFTGSSAHVVLQGGGRRRPGESRPAAQPRGHWNEQNHWGTRGRA